MKPARQAFFWLCGVLKLKRLTVQGQVVPGLNDSGFERFWFEGFWGLGAQACESRLQGLGVCGFSGFCG